MDDNMDLMNALEALSNMIIKDDSFPENMRLDFVVANQMHAVNRLINNLAKAVTIDSDDINLKKETLEYLGMVKVGIKSYIETKNIEIKLGE